MTSKFFKDKIRHKRNIFGGKSSNMRRPYADCKAGGGYEVFTVLEKELNGRG